MKARVVSVDFSENISFRAKYVHHISRQKLSYSLRLNQCGWLIVVDRYKGINDIWFACSVDYVSLYALLQDIHGYLSTVNWYIRVREPLSGKSLSRYLICILRCVATLFAGFVRIMTLYSGCFQRFLLLVSTFCLQDFSLCRERAMAYFCMCVARFVFFALMIIQCFFLAGYPATYKNNRHWYALAASFAPAVIVWICLTIVSKAKLRRLFFVWGLYICA